MKLPLSFEPPDGLAEHCGITEEFGVPALTQGTVSQPFRFDGEQRDGESSFVFLRARYYSPSIGRFTTRDPLFGGILSPVTLDRFSYVANIPLRDRDPSGLYLVTDDRGLAWAQRIQSGQLRLAE